MSNADIHEMTSAELDLVVGGKGRREGEQKGMGGQDQVVATCAGNVAAGVGQVIYDAAGLLRL